MHGSFPWFTKIEPRPVTDALKWVRGWFEPLKPFFEATARDNDAMLVWLD